MACGLMACNALPSPNPSPPSPTPEQTILASPSPTAEATLPLASPTPTEQPRQTLPKYHLSALLDYDRHHLMVDEQILYFNRSTDALSEILLLVEPNRYPGVFRLNSLTWEDGQPISRYALETAQLHLPLERPLSPGDSIGFSLSYELNLPQLGAPFGYTERQTNLADWYPFIPPYRDGQGWLVHQNALQGEHLAYDVADFQVEIRLSTPRSASGRTLTIAASAPAQVSEDVYHYQVEAARNFTWSVSDQYYQVLSTTVDSTTILSYSFPYHVKADRPALDTTAQAFSLYNRLFVPYPLQSLSVVEADFLNGMEYHGLFFLSHAFYDYYTGTPENNLIIIAAHETCHQWFYGLVGNDQALEPWLDEALATYCERLFYENIYGDQGAKWWWQNRVYVHQPQGWVDSTIYDHTEFKPYKDAIYLRGALFLEDLRNLLGDEAFFAFLRDYLQRYAYRQATAEDFFAVLRDHTAADLSGLLDEYFAHR
jgi:hypothetical protein